MSNVYIDDQVFTNIANAIRNRNGETTTYKPREMDDAIKDLHNIKVKKWERPSDWPDYSKVDLTNQEVIYLTYDCTDTYDPKPISIRVYGAYSVVRGQINNGVFTAASAVTNVASGGIFREMLPTDEGDYVVYRVTPQEDAVITRFEFARWDDLESSIYNCSWMQPCVERYCRIPSWIGTGNRTINQYTWTTRYLVADTVMDAVPDNLTNAYNDGGYVLAKVNMSTCSFADITSLASMCYNQYNLYEIYLPHDLSNKCTNISNLFNGCHGLINLDLSGWDTSGVTNFQATFSNCNELVDMKGLEDFDFSSATTMNNFLSHMYMLKELDTSKWKTTNKLTNLANCFDDLRQIKSIDVSGINTENVTTFYCVFSSCRNLKSIDLSNWIISNKVTSVACFFQYCRNLETIIRNKDWDTSNVTGFDGMFRECRRLQEIDISDFDFSKATNISNMFNGCSNLRKIKATINVPLITNKNNVGGFVNSCWSLEDVSELIVTNCTFMPDFRFTFLLSELNVPSSVTAISDFRLGNMEHLKYLYFTNHTSIPTLNSAGDITTGWNNFLKIVIPPDDLYDTWIATSPWNNATLASHIIPESYLNCNALIDLSSVTWSKNSSYSESSAIGTAFSSMMTNGSGNRLASDLIDVSAFSDYPFEINFNSGFQVSYLAFDADGNYLGKYKNWNQFWMYIDDSTVKKICLILRRGNGSPALEPADWEDSGIRINKYLPAR